MGVDGSDCSRLEAELEIRNLVAALAQLADTGEVDAYVALFTQDAVWQMPANPLTQLDASTRTGHDAIAEGVHERRAAGLQGPGSGSMHVITTLRVEVVDDNEAVGHAYWLFYTDTRTSPVLGGIGQYHDRYLRTAAGWKLAHRSVVVG